jgi:hypothetical protein
MSRASSLAASHGFRLISCTIGGGIGGPARASRGDCGHWKGSWITVPGARASETTSSTACSTARWPARSPGKPSGRPNGNSIPATRGAPTEAVNSGIIDNDTVAMPQASRTFWTSPTDRQQMGQTGTSMATSTASAAIRAAIAGAVQASSWRGCRM